MTASHELEGKVAVVTGGAIGIGRGIALHLAAAGADVALTWASHETEGRAVVEEIEKLGRRAVGFHLDATSSQVVNEGMARVATQLGRLDFCVNNAGGLIARVDVADMTDDHWDAVITLNLTSAFYCTRAALTHMADGGRLVNVASVAGLNGGGQGAAAYATAKAGMNGFTRALVKEVAPRGITVNAVAPGLILDTPFHEQFTPPEAQAATISSLPMQRAGYPADVASAVTWLCSPGAAWITGEVINISGGQYLA